MATTQNTYTGDGSTTDYTLTFPYIAVADVRVSLDNVGTTAFSLINSSTLRFNSAPGNGVAIRIYRVTSDSHRRIVFTPGSTIKADDLNDAHNQSVFLAQELSNTVASVSAGDVADGSLTTAKLADGAVTTAKISPSAVTTSKILNANVTTAKIADANVTTAKIADSNVTEAKLAIHNAPSVNKVLGYTSNGLEWTEPVTFLKPSCLLRHPPDTALAHVSDSNTSNGVPITHQHVEHNVGIPGQLCVVSNSNSRIQVKVAGTYLVSALTSGTITNIPDPSDAIGFVLRKNGTIYSDEQTFGRSNFGANANEEYIISFCIPVVLAVDDYLEVAYMNIDASTATCRQGYFSVSKI